MFREIIFKLRDLGAFNFLFPYLLTSAIFYGLLRKSEIFGKPEKNVAVNGVIALVSALMVWAFPVLRGVDIETQMSAFFMQGMIMILVFMVGLMLTSMLLPEDLPTRLKDTFLKESGPVGAVVIASLIIGAVIFLTSGLVGLFITPEMLAKIPTDIFLILGVVIILVVPLVWIMSGGTKPTQSGQNNK